MRFGGALGTNGTISSRLETKLNLERLYTNESFHAFHLFCLYQTIMVILSSVLSGISKNVISNDGRHKIRHLFHSKKSVLGHQLIQEVFCFQRLIKTLSAFLDFQDINFILNSRFMEHFWQRNGPFFVRKRQLKNRECCAEDLL